jgi:hypothetical protein
VIDWTHSICLKCWHKRHPGMVPHVVIDANLDLCCYCGAANQDGIYVRQDPKEVHHANSPIPFLD